MTNILVRRDQFNITPEGILHKPTDARFVPSPTNRSAGTISQGCLYASRGDSDAFDAEEVKKMMLQLWAEYLAKEA
jgi:hypothetical protein